MLIKFMPKVEHLKCIMLTPKEGLELGRSMVQLIPGTNEVTDDEWKAMRGNIQSELDSGEIKILAQKLSAGVKAKNLKEMSAANAVRYVNECEKVVFGNHEGRSPPGHNQKDAETWCGAAGGKRRFVRGG